MSGVIKLVDKIGMVVSQKKFQCNFYLNAAKNGWYKMYKNINESNFIIEYDVKKPPPTKEERAARKKLKLAIKIFSKSGHKIRQKPHLDHHLYQ